MARQQQNKDEGYIYDAFVSHATDPDSALARRVKSDLEAFHKRPGVQRRYSETTGEEFEPIRLCVDGKDFVFPKSDPDDIAPIDALVREYLLKSRSLLVLSGTETIKHPWINREIKWYRELNPANEIHFALTHASDTQDYEGFVPPALKDGNLGLFSDLRGFYQGSRKRLADFFHYARSERLKKVLQSAGSWKSVRHFDEELARLAARLLSSRGHRAFSVEDLEKGFETELRRARKRRLAVGATLAVVVLGLAGILGDTLARYWEEQRLRTNRIWTSQADLLRRDLDASLMDSLALSANAIANGNREDAPRGMVETLQRLVHSELLYQRSGDPGPFEPGKRRAHIETLTELDGGAEVLLGGIDGYLVLFDTEMRVELAELYLAHTRILDIAVLPGGEDIAVGTRSGLFFARLRRENGVPNLELVARSKSDEAVFGVAYDPGWDRIVGGQFSGQVVAYDRPVDGAEWEGKTLYTLFDHEISGTEEAPYIPASISAFELRRLPGGTSRAYLGSFNHFAAALDLAVDSAIEVWPALFDENTSLTSIDVDDDGNLVLVTDLDGRIFLIDGKTGDVETEVRPYRADPASLAVEASGHWTFARPDVLGNVGVDLHPSGLFFGVSSHDRTTKFFDTGSINSGGISAVVHNEMARDITFSSDGQTGYSMGDDGSLQRFRLFENYEALRLGGIDRAYPLPHEDGTLLLVSGDGGPLLWSPELGIRPVPGLPEAPSNWKALPRETGNLIFFGADTRLFTATSKGADPLCDGHTIEALLDLKESEDVSSVYPLGQAGPLLFTPIDVDGGTIRLMLFEPAKCAGFPLSPAVYSEDARIVTLEGGVVLFPEPGRAILWRDVNPASEPEEILAQDTDTLDLAVGNGTAHILAVVNQATPCLCHFSWSHALTSRFKSTGNVCEALTTDRVCSEVALPTSWPEGGNVEPVRASLSGRFFILRGRDARLGLLKMPDWPWQRIAIHPVAPRQTRPISAPFAFNETETALAVPNGDTGIRIVDPSDLSVLSVLPTPSRVYSLAFNGSDLLSRDGANENAIFRVQPWMPEDILDRSCEYWPKGSLPTVPADVPDILPRSAFCED